MQINSQPNYCLCLSVAENICNAYCVADVGNLQCIKLIALQIICTTNKSSLQILEIATEYELQNAKQSATQIALQILNSAMHISALHILSATHILLQNVTTQVV